MAGDVGDRVIVTMEFERTITDVSSHGGGTDTSFNKPLPPGGRIISTRPIPPKKRRR